MQAFFVGIFVEVSKKHLCLYTRDTLAVLSKYFKDQTFHSYQVYQETFLKKCSINGYTPDSFLGLGLKDVTLVLVV